MSQQFNRYVILVGDLNSATVRLENRDIIRKFIRSLPSVWDMHSIALSRSENFNTLTLNELFGILKTYELEMKQTRNNQVGKTSDYNAALASQTHEGSSSTYNNGSCAPSSGSCSDDHEAFISRHGFFVP